MNRLTALIRQRRINKAIAAQDAMYIAQREVEPDLPTIEQLDAIWDADSERGEAIFYEAVLRYKRGQERPADKVHGVMDFDDFAAELARKVGI